MTEWKFLTNHAHVLLCVAHEPQIRLREIADAVGITERAAHRIIAELEEGGYIARERRGRRNHYRFFPDAVMAHPNFQNSMLGNLTLSELVAPFIDPETHLLDARFRRGAAQGAANRAGRLRAVDGQR